MHTHAPLSRRRWRALAACALALAPLTALSAQPAQAAPSQRLVFVADNPATSGYDVYRSALDGSGRRSVLSVPHGVYVRAATVAPDGRHVAVTTYDYRSNPPAKALRVVNIDGTGGRVLARGAWGAPRWSRNGAKLLFNRSLPNGESRLAWVNTTGTPSVRTVPYSIGLVAAGWRDATTVWAKDTLDHEHRLARIHLDGSERQDLGGTERGSDPVFSPDGSTVVFERQQGDDPDTSTQSDLVRMPADRSAAPVVIATGDGYNENPTFSPDGQTVYFDKYARNASGLLTGDLWKVSSTAVTPHTATPVVVTTDHDEYTPSAALVDSTPPGSPTSLTASRSGSKATVRWVKPSAPDLARVVVCRASGSTAPSSLRSCGTRVYAGLATSVTDSVASGRTYSYAAFAVDTSGNTSGRATRTLR